MRNALFTGLRGYLAQKAREGHACRAVREPEPEEARPSDGEAGTAVPQVHLVEHDSLQVRDTGFRSPEDAAASGFRFFLDGVQFTRLIQYVDNIPLLHHLSAAAILQRDPGTRRLSLWDWSGIRELILVPLAYLSRGEFDDWGVAVSDTTDISRDAPLDAMALRALAYGKSLRLRRDLEVDLIKRWIASGEEGWLMVDGPLMLLPKLDTGARMVGVIKSFGAQFFTGEEQLKVIGLQQGFRTTAFQVPRGVSAAPAGEEEARLWFSWYVRIRDYHDHDVDFGLLRVETPPDPAMLAAADEISRWLIAERAPLSTPDPRWANLLYPIHACERCLKSMLPQRNRVHLQLS